MLAINLLNFHFITGITVTGATLYCYSCVGTHPGCGLSTFRYAWNQGKPCPRYNDRCVKLIEQRGADVLVTRDCKIIYVPLCVLHYISM